MSSQRLHQETPAKIALRNEVESDQSRLMSNEDMDHGIQEQQWIRDSNSLGEKRESEKKIMTTQSLSHETSVEIGHRNNHEQHGEKVDSNQNRLLRDENENKDKDEDEVEDDDEDQDEYMVVDLSNLKEFKCPICLGIIRKTRVVMECMHRFCKECIEKSMRLSKRECPVCRTHIASRRSLREDTNFDTMISLLYQDIQKYEEEDELALQEEDERTLSKEVQASSAQTLPCQTEELDRKWNARAIATAFERRRRRRSQAIPSRERKASSASNVSNKPSEKPSSKMTAKEIVKDDKTSKIEIQKNVSTEKRVTDPVKEAIKGKAVATESRPYRQNQTTVPKLMASANASGRIEVTRQLNLQSSDSEDSEELKAFLEQTTSKPEKTKNLPTVEVASSREPILEPAPKNMEITQANITPEVSSTFEKLDNIELGLGAPKVVEPPKDRVIGGEEENKIQSESESSPHQTALQSSRPTNSNQSFEEAVQVPDIEDVDQEQIKSSNSYEEGKKERVKEPNNENSPIPKEKNGEELPLASDDDDLIFDESVFEVLDKWTSLNSQSALISEASENQLGPDDQYNRTWQKFKSLAFDEDLETNLYKPNYKKEIRIIIDDLDNTFNDVMPDEDRDLMNSFIVIFDDAYPLKKKAQEFVEATDSIENATKDKRTGLETVKKEMQELKLSYSDSKASISIFEKEEQEIKNQIDILKGKLESIQNSKQKSMARKNEVAQQQRDCLAKATALSTALNEECNKKLALEVEKAKVISELEVLRKKHNKLRLVHQI